jgi:hypothetical protein
LSSGGVLSGTPTAAGTYTFTVQVTDSDSPANVATKTYTVTVLLAISPATLPAGTAGTAYSKTLTANGGTAPYSWVVASGTVPPGLALSSGGVLSGTPTTAGTYTFTVRATDSASPANVATKTYTVTIKMAISPKSLPAGTVNVPYSQALTAIGGTGSETWTVASGTLPPGLTLSSAGVLSGTPTTAGSFTFTVQVTDSDSPANVATRSYTLTINP